MKIKVVNEKTGNPFKYFADEGLWETKYLGYGHFRGYRKPENVREVMDRVLSHLDLSLPIDCLEVGSGGNPRPSQALSAAGAKVYTLDADWDPERHTDLSWDRYKEMREKLKEGILIPRVAGRNEEVVCYIGDLAFIRDEQSQLKETEFNLVYFWGSLHTGGINSAVNVSRQARELDVEIPYTQRIKRVVPAVKNKGRILIVSEVFSQDVYETNPRDIGILNSMLLDDALYLASATERKGNVIEVFGQTKNTYRRLLEDEVRAGRLKEFPEKDMKKWVSTDPFERMIGEGVFSNFGEDDNYKNLRKVVDSLSSEERKALRNLGMIDAVFVEY